MALYNIGNFIKQRREELGITQNELAEGLCSLPTLSRIESGSHVPHGNTLRSLLQRLGYSDALMLLPASREEFEITRLQVKIRQLYNTRDREGARELFAKLGEYKDFFSVSDRQFYEVMHTVFYKKDFTSEEILDKLESAMRLTHPDYGASNLPRIITYEEATALNNIAIIYSEMGKTDYTIKVLYHLKDFYEHDVLDISESMRALPTIMYNLSKFLGLSGRYDECIDVCKQCINLMKTYHRTDQLSLTYYNLAWASVRRNCEDDLKTAKQAAIKSYCLSLALEERPEFLEKLKKFLIDNFNENIVLIT